MNVDQAQFLYQTVVDVLEAERAPMTAAQIWHVFESRVMSGTRPWEETEVGKRGIDIREAYDWRRGDHLGELVRKGRITMMTIYVPYKIPVAYYLPVGSEISLDQGIRLL